MTWAKLLRTAAGCLLLPQIFPADAAEIVDYRIIADEHVREADILEQSKRPAKPQVLIEQHNTRDGPYFYTERPLVLRPDDCSSLTIARARRERTASCFHLSAASTVAPCHTWWAWKDGWSSYEAKKDETGRPFKVCKILDSVHGRLSLGSGGTERKAVDFLFTLHGYSLLDKAEVEAAHPNQSRNIIDPQEFDAVSHRTMPQFKNPGTCTFAGRVPGSAMADFGNIRFCYLFSAQLVGSRIMLLAQYDVTKGKHAKARAPHFCETLIRRFRNVSQLPFDYAGCVGGSWGHPAPHTLSFQIYSIENNRTARDRRAALRFSPVHLARKGAAAGHPSQEQVTTKIFPGTISRPQRP